MLLRLLTIPLLLCLILTTQVQAASPLIKAGLLDLRGWNSQESPAFALRGEVEFHWQRFLHEDGPDPQPSFIPFPGGWNEVAAYPVHGYASYRLHVILDQTQRLALFLTPVWTSGRIWVDGTEIKSYGTMGRTADTTVGDLGDFYEYSFTPQTKEFDLVFEVANFDLFLGGVVEPSYFGLPDAIHLKSNRILGWGAFLIGTLLIMSIYHFGLFTLRRSDRTPLFYGLLCLGVATHMIMGDPSDTISLFHPMNFHSRVLFFNLGWVLATVSFIYFCTELFPQEFSNKVSHGLAIVAGIYALVICNLHVRQIIVGTFWFQTLSVMAASYALIMITLAVYRQRQSALFFLISMMILFLCTVHDMFLNRGTYSDIPLVGFGLLNFTFCQSYLLSARFSKAFMRAETSESEVRRLLDDLKFLNQNLETKVDEQTREIRSIMQHIKLGIFTISGDNAVISKEYSHHLEDLLQQKNLMGQPALPYLFEGSLLTQEARHQVESALRASFGEDLINFELNEDIFPKQIIRQDARTHERIYDLTWNPITNQDDRIEKVLVTLGDVTELKNMEKQTRDLQSELKIVAEILNVKEEEFRRFVRTSRSFLDQNNTLMETADPSMRDAETLKVIFMNLHTLKGVARTLEFRQLSDMIHTMEQFYSKLAKQDGEKWEPDQIRQDMRDLAEHITEYEEIAQTKLGRFLDETARLILPAPKALESFQSLSELLHQADPQQALLVQPLLDALQKNLFVSLRDTFQDIFRQTKALAKDLEKPEPGVFLDIPSFQISTKTDELLRNAFLHLLRNAMDHGIENPKDRMLAGKAPAGLIHLRMEEADDFMRVELNDDGRGLNVKYLERLGQQRGMIPQENPTSWQTVAELIFQTGVSTARAITGISGRGIGMPAVARFIEELGGTLRIELLETQPNSSGFIAFRLVMRLPMSLFYRENQPPRKLRSVS